ncbi:MAG: tetratricopeptide repeat protein [Polyangiaceae bacterium]
MSSIVADDRDKILQSAQKLVDKKKYDKAIGEYRKLIREDPGDVRTLLKIGDLHLKLDQHDQAIETYEQVGGYYYREGFSVKAIAVYKQIRGIIKRHAPHLEGRYGHIVPRLAEIYTQLGLVSDALAAYDEVATRLRQEGRERDALDIFKKVVDLDPQNPIAHLRVADSRARLGDIDQAVERFGEAAEIMVRLGRIDDALKVLERLLEYRSDVRWARRAAQLYLERGGPHDGMASLTKLQVAFKENPKDLDTLAMLAQAFDSINQPKKAVEVLKEAARVAKDAGNATAVDQLLTTLMQRAPEDTLVGKLSQWRRSQAEGQAEAEVEVEVLEAEEIEVEESYESMEEVFELTDGEYVTDQVDTDDLFGMQDEDSAVRRLVGEAERQRAGGHLQHAIQLLRDGVRNLGSSLPLRQKLSDLLLEAGDTQGSMREKLLLAQDLSGEGRADDALQMVDEVLLLQPDHTGALQLRESLAGHGTAPVRGRDQNMEDLQLNQPLQSYDVESGGVEEALHRSRHGSSSSTPAVAVPPPTAQAPTAPQAPAYQAGGHAGGNVGQLDDPFGEPTHVVPTAGTLDENALDQAEMLAEQGRLDEARTLLHSLLAAVPNHPLVLERLADIENVAAHHNSHSGPYPVQAAYDPYAAQRQSYYDPAAQDPARYSNPGAYDVGAYGQDPYGQDPYGQEQAPYSQPPHSQAPHSQAPHSPAPHSPAPHSPAPHSPGPHSQPPHSLGPYSQPPYSQNGYAQGYPQAPQGSQAPPYSQPPQDEGYYGTPSSSHYPAAYGQDPYGADPYGSEHQGNGAYDDGRESVAPQSGSQWASEVDSLLDQVREGVKNQVAEGDAATHYDLGVAYYEMGLHSDAISELTLASRDPARECVCLSMIGNIQLQLGDLDKALDALHRALNAPYKTQEQEAALGYEIANTYEYQGLQEEALQYFEWLATGYPDYQDGRGSVAERIHRLRSESGAVPRPGASYGDIEEGS